MTDTPTFKTNSYRVMFISPTADPGNDGKPDHIIRNRTWPQVLDEKLDAGAQFIAIRNVGGWDELTVREPV